VIQGTGVADSTDSAHARAVRVLMKTNRETNRKAIHDGVVVHHRHPVGPIISGRSPDMPYWTRDADALSWLALDFKTCQ
jgi:hypothetical protein